MKTSQLIQPLSGLAGHLVHDGMLTLEFAAQALSEANRLGMSLIHYLVKNNILSGRQIFESCTKTFDLPTFDLTHYDFTLLKDSPLNSEIILRYQIIPIKKQNNNLYIGLSDPTDKHTLDTVRFYTGLTTHPILVEHGQLTQFIDKHFVIKNQKNLRLNLLKDLDLEENANTIQENSVNYDEPLIQFVDHIIQHAIQQSTSDIHIEPYETLCRIRYRQDGILYEMAEIPINLATRLVTRLKVMAKLDISERRLPQDGRFQLHHIDIRINTCPTLFGEKIVLRLLDANKSSLDINDLGLTENQNTIFIDKISQPQGLILVTGPTGSGKTVTLYTALKHLNTPEKNISTVEDPVEIQLNGINQVHINPKINLHFATALRTFLRQDPDIIMVGEIRDTETAEIAIQAAQTGHLVLSTIHTNSAVETLMRLRSIGIAPYNIISAISLIVAQRLVRKLCVHCKQPEIISQQMRNDMGFVVSDSRTIYRAIGCDSCLQGYRGRVGIYEFLPITQTLAQLIMSNANTHDILHQAKKEGFISLRQTGFQKVLEGITSLTEINRVTHK